MAQAVDTQDHNFLVFTTNNTPYHKGFISTASESNNTSPSSSSSSVAFCSSILYDENSEHFDLPKSTNMSGKPSSSGGGLLRDVTLPENPKEEVAVRGLMDLPIQRAGATRQFTIIKRDRCLENLTWLAQCMKKLIAGVRELLFRREAHH